MLSRLERKGRINFSIWKIRLVLLLFFALLSSVGSIIVYQAYDQLQWESFHRFQLQAKELSERIERTIEQLVRHENERSFGDYQFTVAMGGPGNVWIQRSPLANLVEEEKINGLVGYFQIDDLNRFTTPLLPAPNFDYKRYGLSELDYASRLAQQNSTKKILLENKLLTEDEKSFEAVENLQQEKRSSLVKRKLVGKKQYIEDNNLDDTLRSKVSDRGLQDADDNEKAKEDRLDNHKALSKKEKKPKVRFEQELLETLGSLNSPSRIDSGAEAEQHDLSQQVEDDASVAREMPTKFSLFESRIGSLNVLSLETGHLLFYRQVWQENKRYMQGFLLDRSQVVNDLIAREYQASVLANMSALAVVWADEIIEVLEGGENPYSERMSYSGKLDVSTSRLSGTVLYNHNLPTPLGDGELLYTIEHLPLGAASRAIYLSAASFLLILLLGCYLIYRLLVKQVAIAQQQQDFVSSISHELKTPLTSIRMYGEMLKEGWVDESKKNEYYNYIFHESERLTRLINNILQLARMTRSELGAEIKERRLGEIIDILKSTISSQVSRAGFELNLNCGSPEALVKVDEDLILQVLINLVDNAIKFSYGAEIKRIDIEFGEEGEAVVLKIRDYGPGVDQSNMNQIFSLFYRGESELIRETKGTGIGLALVKELLRLMNASISVKNVSPGAMFVISFSKVEDE